MITCTRKAKCPTCPFMDGLNEQATIAQNLGCLPTPRDILDLKRYQGRDLDAAVAAYERVVAPQNYKRPTALVTPRMVDEAKKRLEELGLMGCLSRRLLSEQDLPVTHALHVYRPTVKAQDVFDTIKQETLVNPKSLTKVEEVSINDFIQNILPTSKSVRVLLENNHLPNFVSLVGPAAENPEDKTLFKWRNNFSWYYSGEVADSIKERVKAAGGNVTGLLRVSLSWHNHDDLDLRILESNRSSICFHNKHGSSGGVLDVDMNAGCGTTREPVENVVWKKMPTVEGTYGVAVNQYMKRENIDVGYEIEIEYDGQVWNFAFPSSPRTTDRVVEFTISKKEGFKLLSATGGSIGNYASKEKWGCKTGQFHQVKAITLSPNYWNSATGNKQFFFLLEGCKADEKIRPFYNEFLADELAKDRKVFEVIGGKITVEPAERELSGLGFSETKPNHIYAEVEGSFKRTVKVTF